MKPVLQDKVQEIRYTRKQDFMDEVAEAYLDRNPSAEELGELLAKAPS